MVVMHVRMFVFILVNDEHLLILYVFLYINFCQYVNIYDTDTPYITCHLCHTISSKCYFEATGLCRDPFKQSSDLG